MKKEVTVLLLIGLMLVLQSFPALAMTEDPELVLNEAGTIVQGIRFSIGEGESSIIIVDGREYLPLAIFANLLGAEVKFNKASKGYQLSVTSEDLSFLAVNTKASWAGGVSARSLTPGCALCGTITIGFERRDYPLPFAATEYNGVAYVPLASVAEALGLGTPSKSSSSPDWWVSTGRVGTLNLGAVALEVKKDIKGQQALLSCNQDSKQAKLAVIGHQVGTMKAAFLDKKDLGDRRFADALERLTEATQVLEKVLQTNQSSAQDMRLVRELTANLNTLKVADKRDVRGITGLLDELEAILERR